MPGLFDNGGPSGGDGSGIGGILGGLGATLFPGVRNYQMQQQALQSSYNALRANGLSHDEAIAEVLNPGMGKELWQQRIFNAQMQDYARTHPEAGFNQAIYGTSPEGLKGEYGAPTPVQGYEFGPYKAPGFISHGQVQPPPGFPGTQPPGAATGIQGQPTQQPQSGQPNLPPVAQTVLDYERQLAANKAKGEEEGSAQTTVQGSVDQINRSIQLIDELAKHPGMKWATGALGSIPPIPNTSAYSFVKGLDQLKDQLTLDILPSLQRKGSRISPALVELLQKSTAGQELDRSSPDFPRALQNTRDALMQIRGATEKMANVPVSQENFEGRTVTNKKTGQKGIIKNGQLVPQP